MFSLISRYKGRLSVFALSFVVGVMLALAFKVLLISFVDRVRARVPVNAPSTGACAAGNAFASPEEIAGALRSDDVSVRRETFRRLSLLPNLLTAYYDFERDVDFPARAEEVKLRRANLDDSPEEEAVVTFVRGASPAAIVLKRGDCGWKIVAVVSAWLRFEDYPYADWLELPEAITPGRHVLVVRDSTGDATRYTRRARVLSLAGDHLEQVAEVEEESIAPVEGYAGADWAEVKRRRAVTFSFTTSRTAGEEARLHVERREEVVRYSGVEPLNVYWSESDGVWHQARRHWRTRQFEVTKPAVVSEEQFVWSEEKNRFVPAAQ
jgi:hypothetical protein